MFMKEKSNPMFMNMDFMKALLIHGSRKPCCTVPCCAVLSLLPQVHQMEDVAVVSIFGTVGMLAAMAVVVGKLVAIYLTTPQPAPTELVASGVSFQVSCPQQQPATD